MERGGVWSVRLVKRVIEERQGGRLVAKEKRGEKRVRFLQPSFSTTIRPTLSHPLDVPLTTCSGRQSAPSHAGGARRRNSGSKGKEGWHENSCPLVASVFRPRGGEFSAEDPYEGSEGRPGVKAPGSGPAGPQIVSSPSRKIVINSSFSGQNFRDRAPPKTTPLPEAFFKARGVAFSQTHAVWDARHHRATEKDLAFLASREPESVRFLLRQGLERGRGKEAFSLQDRRGCSSRRL